MSRVPCSKCKVVSTTNPDGMCATCRRTWTRQSFDSALLEVTAPQRERICELSRAGFAMSNLVSAMKREHGAGPTGWGWHWALVIAAHDELHRRVS